MANRPTRPSPIVNFPWPEHFHSFSRILPKAGNWRSVPGTTQVGSTITLRAERAHFNAPINSFGRDKARKHGRKNGCWCIDCAIQREKFPPPTLTNFCHRITPQNRLSHRLISHHNCGGHFTWYLRTNKIIDWFTLKEWKLLFPAIYFTVIATS